MTDLRASSWHRDRGVFTLEESIRMMTSRPMRVIGFADRGSLEVGKLSYPRADAGIAPTAYLLERRRWYCWWPAKRAGAAFWASTLGNVVGRTADGAAGTSRRMPGCAWCGKHVEGTRTSGQRGVAMREASVRPRRDGVIGHQCARRD